MERWDGGESMAASNGHVEKVTTVRNRASATQKECREWTKWQPRRRKSAMSANIPKHCAKLLVFN